MMNSSDPLKTDVKIVVLSNGLPLMGEIEEGEDSIMLTRPVTVQSLPPDPNSGKSSIGFGPFLEFTKEFKDGIFLSRKNILTILTPVVELETKYRSVFSGIVLPRL